MAGNGGGSEINLGFSRFALVGIMGTRITRIGRIDADFSDLELTEFSLILALRARRNNGNTD